MCTRLSNVEWAALALSLTLSRRELQILKSILDDKTELAIALMLGISQHTVHSHIKRLYNKLHVRSRAACVTRILSEYKHLRNQQSP